MSAWWEKPVRPSVSLIELEDEFAKRTKEFAAFGDGVPASCVAALCMQLAGHVRFLQNELDIACARIQRRERQP